MPFHAHAFATFLTLASLACGRTPLVDDDLFRSRDSSTTDSSTFDAGNDASDVPYPVRPGCPVELHLEGRDASVPVDIIWVVRGSSNLLRAFRDATERYWAALRTGNIDTMNILIVGHEDALPGPEGSYAGRVRYITDTSGDAAIALSESYEYYSSLLRPDSKRHVVVVSSGTTLYTPVELHRTLQEQLGERYTLHAVVSEQLAPSVDNPLGVCTNSMGSADRGDVVFGAVANETFGTTSSICAEDWNALIDRISERIAIRIPIPCAFSLPIIRPPGIRQYNPRGVRIRANYGDERVLLRNVEDRSQCFAGDWWLYAGSDRIHICDHACTQIEEAEASLDVELDCGY